MVLRQTVREIASPERTHPFFGGKSNISKMLFLKKVKSHRKIKSLILGTSRDSFILILSSFFSSEEFSEPKIPFPDLLRRFGKGNGENPEKFQGIPFPFPRSVKWTWEDSVVQTNGMPPQIVVDGGEGEIVRYRGERFEGARAV